MTTIKAEAPAKINLTLEVLRRMSNGFHKLRMVVLKIPDLKDELEFQIQPGVRKIIIKCDNPEIPLDERNICHKAVNVFLDKLKKEVEISIKIKKKIPVGAGLSGGSSDAAVTFLALNKYFNKPFLRKDLIKMASSVGKDVPFFFSSKRGALVEGSGEKIRKKFDFSEGCFLIVNPRINISTKEAYGQLSKDIWFMKNKDRTNISENLIKALKSGNNFEKYFYNDFEMTVEKKYPVIKEIKQALLAFGAEGALMSGSGSTVFGYFKSFEKAEIVRKIIQKHYGDFLVVVG